MTFNPDWDKDCNTLCNFTDVRELQKEIKARGIKIELEADENTTGPASFKVIDPDGNPIMIDQHM